MRFQSCYIPTLLRIVILSKAKDLLFLWPLLLLVESMVINRKTQNRRNTKCKYKKKQILRSRSG